MFELTSETLHAYNASYSGDRHQEYRGQPWQKVPETPPLQ
jgi:hypothetical protein